MELWYEWEENNDERLYFDDSDRFEEDSLCSCGSDPESLYGNWGGWKRSSQSGVQEDLEPCEGKVESLIEVCARTVAKHLPFETVERIYPQIPEQLQLRIGFWSFPPFEEDIRLYSCLANGSPDKFNEGEQLLKVQAVKDALQIGEYKGCYASWTNAEISMLTSVWTSKLWIFLFMRTMRTMRTSNPPSLPLNDQSLHSSPKKNAPTHHLPPVA